MAQEALNNVLASIADTHVRSNELAIGLFSVAASLPKSATELRRIAIEVCTFSSVTPHLETTLRSGGTTAPTEALFHVLLMVLKNANNVLHYIEDTISGAARTDHDHEFGPSDHTDTVRPVLKSAQMTVNRLSLEALRLALALVTATLEWGRHCSQSGGDLNPKYDADQIELCAKCASLSLHASIMQLQVVEKISLNETTARRLSEEREHAEELLRRIDRKPGKAQSHARPTKTHPAEPISATLEELMFAPISDELHSTHSWIAQSTEHSLLLRKWTGIDLTPVTGGIAEPTPVADPQQPRRLTLFAKIRSHSGIHTKSDQGKLLPVQ